MAFLDWLKIIFLGIVEGITEWLPISSTGHLILVDALWKTENHPVLTEAFMTKLFDVVIQLGAIIAVLVLFWHKLWPFHTKARRRQRSWFREASDNRFVCGVQCFCDNYCYMDKIVMWLKIAVSCVPAAIAGFLLDDWMSAHLYNPYVVAAMLILLALGASDETICADFVQSNTCRKEEIEALWAEHAEEIAARPEQKYFYLGISGVHPDDGPFVLQTIREQYGTTDAYLEAEYGLTPARLMRLRRMYLE